MSGYNPSEERARWQARWNIALTERGGTEEARQQMIDDTPDWLRRVLDIPTRHGDKPSDCTCARWYVDGTHTAECRHQPGAGDEYERRDEMTKDEIRNIKAGREMDALIAEKVMGWKKIVIGGVGWFVKESPLGMSYQYMTQSGDFEPSTDIAAAWQVVEKMSSRKDWDEHPVCIVRNYAFKDMWTVELRDYDFDATAETAPLAICRAALLAVMI